MDALAAGMEARYLTDSAERLGVPIDAGGFASACRRFGLDPADSTIADVRVAAGIDVIAHRSRPRRTESNPPT